MKRATFRDAALAAAVSGWALIGSAMLGGCGSDDPAPTAAITAAAPETLDPADDAADDLAITVEYHDADADLGGGLATVHDCRAADLATVFELGPIASEEAIAEGVPITGTLELLVADIGDVPPGDLPEACADLGIEAAAAGEATFCVVLTDAAGHEGSGDCTVPIAIVAAE
jgi:hypothetical protein